MNARMEVNLRSRRREVFGSKKKTGGVPCFLALTTSKGPVPTFLVLSTAYAGMATKAVGAFVIVKLADKCRDQI